MTARAQQAGIKIGDTILSVDGDPIDGGVDLYRLLDRKIGRRVVLSVKSAGQQDERDVPVRPVDVSTEKTLLYRAGARPTACRSQRRATAGWVTFTSPT